jgi:hypothetical protein
MMKYGPTDVVVLAFGEPRFDGSVLAELEKQAAAGTIRVLDAMVLFKDQDERCWRMDLEDMPEEQKAAVGFIETGTRGLFDSDDADTLYECMVPDSAVMALAIEHRWAVDLANTLYANGVEVALNFRVPAPIIDEALALLALDNEM